MCGEILPIMLLSKDFYLILSISIMILTWIGVIFAIGFLILKGKFGKLSPLDLLVLIVFYQCLIVSVINFIPYSYRLTTYNIPPIMCTFVRVTQGVLWYFEYFIIAMIIIERTYIHLSPIRHTEMFKSLRFLIIIGCGCIASILIGILTSFPYNWNKANIKHPIEICICELLVFKRIDIVIHVGSHVIPYILMMACLPIARIKALYDVSQIRKDLGLDLLSKNYDTLKHETLYVKTGELSLCRKLFYAFLLITHSLKFVLILLKESNTYQQVIALGMTLDEQKDSTSKLFYFPTTVIGLFNALYIIAPLYDIICVILLNKSFYKNKLFN